jgi:hypothetical protein
MYITTLGLIWQSMCSSYTDARAGGRSKHGHLVAAQHSSWSEFFRQVIVSKARIARRHQDGALAPLWPMDFSTTSESYCFS